MSYQQRLNAIYKLSEYLGSINLTHPVINLAYVKNNWFTPQWQIHALHQWAQNLNQENIQKWLSNYANYTSNNPKTVAVIMAGNIPLVGFHDLLCILLTNNKALIKTSSDDEVLIKHIVEKLISFEPEFESFITITDGKFNIPFDAVIATGSNNTNRYFEYYFKNKPNILRNNRNSVAVLTGNETPEDFEKLADDVFTYFGLGCRNVSKLMLPEGFDFEPMFNSFLKYHDYVNHNKYNNNYTYHKSIFLMNQTPHLDNGFILLKEDNRLASPLGVVFYNYYKNLDEVEELITQEQNNIQCVTSKIAIGNSIPLGSTQIPKLNSYADGVDTLNFLISLS